VHPVTVNGSELARKRSSKQDRTSRQSDLKQSGHTLQEDMFCSSFCLLRPTAVANEILKALACNRKPNLICGWRTSAAGALTRQDGKVMQGAGTTVGAAVVRSECTSLNNAPNSYLIKFDQI